MIRKPHAHLPRCQFSLHGKPELSTLCPIMSKKNVNLEKSLADLENLVDELESGDLPLEKAMQKFEEGIKLTRQCQAALKDAEQKVEILVQSAGGEDLEDLYRRRLVWLINLPLIPSSATTLDCDAPTNGAGSGDILNSGE